MDKLLTVDELADHLQTPKSWVYHRTRQKGPECIPHIKVGKYCRFNLQDVHEWLMSQQEKEQHDI